MQTPLVPARERCPLDHDLLMWMITVNSDSNVYVVLLGTEMHVRCTPPAHTHMLQMSCLHFDLN